MFNEEWITDTIERLRGQDQERRIVVYPETGAKVRIEQKSYLNFSSNDYLNLARHPHVISRAAEELSRSGCSATASRLVTGTLSSHEELEQRLAMHKGYPCCLLFGSGFLANVGTVSALIGRNDQVFADRLVHASIVDAILLSRAQFFRFQHNDPDHLNSMLANKSGRGKRLVITESVFSMDGDLAPITDITEVALAHGAMVMIDEAHSTGVFGPNGKGLVRAAGLEASTNICMGTLSKALGSYGGFVACSESLRAFLINHSRTFIYSTGLPPSAIGAALGAMDLLDGDDQLGSRLLTRADAFRKRLKVAGFNTGNSCSQIIPIIIGDNNKALSASKRLKEEGIIAIAIRPPTVPQGTARLRLSITLGHSEDDLEDALKKIISTLDRERT